MDSIAGLPADGCSKEASKEEDQVELTRAEMSQVREENSRLKKLLEKIENDYNSLQMRFVGVSQPSEPAVETKNCSDSDHKDAPSGNEPPPELVSLSLGRSSLIQPKKHSRDDSGGPSGAKEELHQRYHHLKKEGDLRLALDFNPLEDCNSDPVEVQTADPSPESSQLETKDEEGRETWPPGKVSKATSKSGGDDDLSQTGAKRARVSVRTRCDTPTMNDGCQWRKYGQKIAKGNPCPRAYYRCTVAPSCPVRKQVQRCAQDTSILITTYEGMHNHPLPFSATAMASTTSAAASMLLSGSSSTSQFASASNTSLCSPLIGLNVNLSENSRSRPFYLPNSSPASYPTITLDLTSEPSTTSNQFNVFSSGGFQSFPRTSSTSLSFAPSQPGMLSSIWANGNLNSGANGMLYSKNHMMMGSLQSGKTFQEHLHQAPFLQKNYQAAAPSQQALTETLTKAITSDPNLRSVIAAAITTMVGGGANGTQVSDDRLQGLGKRLKWDDHQWAAAINSSSPAAGTNGKGCASSFLNQSSFSTPLSVSLGEQQPQQPFSITKSAASATASENAD